MCYLMPAPGVQCIVPDFVCQSVVFGLVPRDTQFGADVSSDSAYANLLYNTLYDKLHNRSITSKKSISDPQHKMLCSLL